MLPRNTPEALAWLGEFASGQGYVLYAVGGVVRDILLGKNTLDIDLACEREVRELGEMLAKVLDAEFKYYPEFMTGTVKVPDGVRIDLARTRKESYPEPGQLPRVEPASIAEDLCRRDFTINAMARSLEPGKWNKLIDPTGGKKDLEAGKIRIIHDQSFIQDPTRIFRAVRYAERLGFEIEPHTAEFLRNSIKRIPDLTGERLLYEFRCIAGEERDVSVRIVKRLEELGGLNFLGKPLEPLSQEMLVKIPEDENCLFLCLLLSHFRKDKTERLPLSKDCLKTIATLRKRNKILEELDTLERPSEITFFLKGHDDRGLSIMAWVEENTDSGKITAYLEHYSKVETEITGEDLKDLGIPPGPSYGVILDKLLAARLDGEVSSRDEELEMAKRMSAEA